MVKHTQTIGWQLADELFECGNHFAILPLKGLRTKNSQKVLKIILVNQKYRLNFAMLKIFWGPARKNVKSTKVIALTVTCPSRYLLVRSQQRKDQNNVWNMFKGNNVWSDFTLFWCYHCWLWKSKCWLGALNWLRVGANPFSKSKIKTLN